MSVWMPGSNITIISGMFAGLARRLFGQRRAVWVAVAGVAVYAILVGASAAVVRAALMGILYLWGRHLGRATFAPISLAAAAIAMTAWNPHMLWDAGFQLSWAWSTRCWSSPWRPRSRRLLSSCTPSGGSP